MNRDTKIYLAIFVFVFVIPSLLIAGWAVATGYSLPTATIARGQAAAMRIDAWARFWQSIANAIITLGNGVFVWVVAGVGLAALWRNQRQKRSFKVVEE
ncbi:MAG: hypothetical protein KC419_01495 [Anaerolineales bacterium]|nr:hypothetical protein [Anaerolineales bacterium]